jgi:O-antigen ligase
MLYIVYGYLILFIIRPFENWHFLGAIHLERIYGILMIGALLVSKHKRSIRCPQTTAVFAFLMVVGLSPLFAYSPPVAWQSFYVYCTLVAFYLVILATVRNEAQLKSFVIVYVCTMGVYQLLSLREYLFFGQGDWSSGMWRMEGFDRTFGGPNSLAASIVYSMPFALGMLKSIDRWQIRLAVVGYAVLSFVCIVLTGSRSGLLGYLLVCLVYILSLKGKQKLYAIAALLVFFLVAWPLFPGQKQARMRTLLGEHMTKGERGSAEQRVRGWGFWQGLEMLQERPLLGVGPGSFAAYSQERLGGRRKDSHNLYGELLGELGILGTLAFASIVAVTVRNTLAVRKQVRAGIVPRASSVAWVASAILVLVFLLFFEGWASHSLFRYNWLWAAALAVLARAFASGTEGQEMTSPAQAPDRADE